MNITQSYILYYFTVLLTTLIVYFSGSFKYKKEKKIIFWSAVILPILISGLRYGVGTDYFNYEKIYYQLTTQGSFLNALANTRYEPGWIILNQNIGFIFGDAQYFFIFIALITWILTFKAVYDNRNNLSMSIAILIIMTTLFNASFNTMRQILASSFLMLSVKPALEHKKLKFIILVLLAASIHYAALMFLIVYWLVNSKVQGSSYIKNILAFMGAVIVILFSPMLLSLITKVDLFSHYSHYDLNLKKIGPGIIVERIPVILIILANIKRLKISNGFYKIIPLYFVGLILLNFGYLADYMSRVGEYFEMLQVFILAAIVKVQSNRYKKLFYGFIIIMYYISWFTYNFIIKNNSETIPYNFFF